MRFILTSLAFYAAAAALIVGAENCIKALNENRRPILGWPIFFAAVSVLVFTLASQYLEVHTSCATRLWRLCSNGVSRAPLNIRAMFILWDRDLA